MLVDKRESYAGIFFRIDISDDPQATYRELCKNDLFFLLVYMLGRIDADTDWIFARCREVQLTPNDMLDLWAREHYKDLSHDTPVITPSGYRMHGDLRPGDVVYSPSGNPVAVLAVTGDLHDPDMYELTFNNLQRSKSQTIKAGADHLWDVEYFDKRRCNGGRVGWVKDKLSTKQLLLRTTQQKKCVSPRWYRIPYHSPLFKPTASLVVDPYVLGVWLGDGSCNTGLVSNMDVEIWDNIRKRGYLTSNDYARHNLSEKSETRNIIGLRNQLYKVGLGECKSSEKHIPIDYLNGSIEQRTELLQGLMDTDGSVTARGNNVYCTTSKTLAENLVDLCKSLGILASLNSYVQQYNDGDYLSYQVNFVTDGTINPFTTKYHNSRKSGVPKQQYWYITDIQSIETVPSQCIQVEGGKYLAGLCNIPTHNSTIVTFALTIQEILKNPEVTIGIFSHTRPIAKGFLRQIKREFELNDKLKRLFPDILYENPAKQAVKWSEDDGIVVKRESNPKESTVEAWGVVDGQPTGKHFSLLVYDDIVTKESVSTPDMIEKTTDALALSYNLGAHGGKRRFIGTRYHFNDTYRTLIDRGTVMPRIHAATHDGSMDGDPVFLTRAQLSNKRRDMGSYIFACQMLQSPAADSAQGFQREWLRTFDNAVSGCNWYLLVDAANGKRKTNDYTSIWAVGLGKDGNYYCIPEVRDRLNLTERAARLIALHRKYRPIQVRYERYGMMSDIMYIKMVQDQQQYRFDIFEVAGSTSKADRIKRLVPLFETGKMYLPVEHIIADYEGKLRDNVAAFIEQEYVAFPVPLHDDMLDALARITDDEGRLAGAVTDKKVELALVWPGTEGQALNRKITRSSWRT